jgi:thiamine-monophosphate kinase
MRPRNSLTEFELIRKYFLRDTTDADVLLGIGDDAALVRCDTALAVATDTLVAGTHFLSTIAPDRLARRALAVNLSDMAAMGATPRWFTLALTLPDADAQWVDAFACGLHETAAVYAMTLIGGDLTRGPLTITLGLIGSVREGAALMRSGASVGDDVYVTGHLGDAAAGLRLLETRAARGAAENYLIDRFELPTARVAAGIYLRGLASAAIDVSDGLLADLGHVCEASRCGARIDIDALPLSPQLRATLSEEDALAVALSGGDDYELCFTAPREHAERLANARVEEIGTRFRRIGQIVTGAGVECHRAGRAFTTNSKGYRHF